MSRINHSIDAAAIQALIPELRVAARDLVDGSTISPDDLVQDALLVALGNWHWLPPGDGLNEALAAGRLARPDPPTLDPGLV